ncbi:dUTPase [Pediococcus argentinicus]|nr:dUTPase [Pediococcus argentinicus]NKZ22317.1 2-deoxyuridine 5-triphosphate nucleotidohydrolase [Pediococcus argentinicus]GEP19318.1 2-deoxyuridine 5-triphosphate nucleotidohydrolase [Pediococcus argentinicus]
MDWAKMLQTSVQLDRDIRAKHNIVFKDNDRILNTYVSLDVELAEIANASEWFKVWKQHRGKSSDGKTARETLLEECADAVDFFLLLANQNQWNHLIVVDDETLEKYSSDKREMNLNQTYLGLKAMLFSAYTYNRSSDYTHAWHMFLKLVIHGLGFSADELEEAFFTKNKVNYDRQDNNY